MQTKIPSTFCIMRAAPLLSDGACLQPLFAVRCYQQRSGAVPPHPIICQKIISCRSSTGARSLCAAYLVQTRTTSYPWEKRKVTKYIYPNTSVVLMQGYFAKYLCSLRIYSFIVLPFYENLIFSLLKLQSLIASHNILHATHMKNP